MRPLLPFLLLAAPLLALDLLTPEQERKTFQLLPGFKAELVAAEPDVIDPVAMAFDEGGRLFVCEMVGYSNGGKGTGAQILGRVRVLTDKDGDGVFDTAAVFADTLRFPTGVQPWKNGVLVTVAPDVVFLEDTDGDGTADKTTVLYTGFGVDNIQQMVNSLQWHADGWVYAVAGANGGTITSPEKPTMPAVALRGRGVRFKPDVPGSLEPTSGGGQYGLTCDLAQHWFTATNSQHLRQIVLPDHYLKRNPNLIVPAVVADIPDHGAACPVFRVSPFEAWRVERTTRRKDGPEAKRLPPTELVPGGFITSACSPLYYDDPLLPEKIRQTILVCDPANNLITRDALGRRGSIYTAKRADEGKEFFASTDNWCRPVHLSTGPDGAIYMLDFYREVIETPLSLPDDIKATVELQSRGKGRIWRITHADAKPLAKVTLDPTKPETLVAGLSDGRAWVRATASRLLYESGSKAAGKLVSDGLFDATLQQASPAAIVGLMRAAALFGVLAPVEVEAGLVHDDPDVRIHALRLAEPFLAKEAGLAKKVAGMAPGADHFVCLQLALTAGYLPPDLAGPTLAALAAGEPDVWLQTAILSSSAGCESEFLAALLPHANWNDVDVMIAKVMAAAGAGGDMKKLAGVLQLIARVMPREQLLLLDQLGQAMRNTRRPLSSLWANPPAEAKEVLAELRDVFKEQAAAATAVRGDISARELAARVLGFGPFEIAKKPLAALLTPDTYEGLQAAALQSLGGFTDPDVTPILLAGWKAYRPAMRREVLEVLTARKERLPALLTALEKRTVSPNELGTSHVAMFVNHPDPAIRGRTKKLLAGAVNADRKKVIDQYQTALTLKGDVGRGRDLFRKNCTACHRLENTGHEVGADLTAALRNKTPAALILDILDPSREVDPRFVEYRVNTTAGKTITGLLAVETPTSVTLKRGDNAEDTILRSQIEEIRATTKSLMPDEFEKQLTPQHLADVVAYLLGPGRDAPGK